MIEESFNGISGPSEVDAVPGSSDASVRTGHLEEAVKLMLLGLLENPSSAPIHNDIGRVLHDLGRFDKAIFFYNKAVSLQKDYPLALNNLGVALAALHCHEEALLRYDQALCISENYPEALNNRGIALQKLGQSKDAIESFRRAIFFNSDFIPAKISPNQLVLIR